MNQMESLSFGSASLCERLMSWQPISAAEVPPWHQRQTVKPPTFDTHLTKNHTHSAERSQRLGYGCVCVQTGLPDSLSSCVCVCEKEKKRARERKEERGGLDFANMNTHLFRLVTSGLLI